MQNQSSPAIQWLKKFLPLRNVLVLGVVGYLLFSGDNTVVQSVHYDRAIDSLKRELDANRDTMLYYKSLNARLASDPELMEQVVREQYGMKKENEDVFIFKSKSK